MKTIMVDMDDVLTHGEFLNIISDYLGYKVKYSDIKSYYMQDVLGDKKEDFFKEFKNINMYENDSLLPDCYDILKKLSEHYKIYICTDYIWREIIEDVGNILKNKYDFLYRELDFLDPSSFIFAADKSIINCDIKIDDKLSNILGAKTKLLFTAYHNKEISKEELNKNNVIRVNNWKEIGELLLKDY